MMNPGSTLHKLVNRPDNWDFSGAAQLYAGVDLGTYKAITIIIDETGRPRAARMRRAEVVRSGLIVDYAGAQNIVREMIEEMRSAASLTIDKEAFSHQKSRSIVEEGRAKHFDPDVVDAFIEMEDEFKRIREFYQDSE